ncbi:MAG TPA: FGGY-family carbohydrate kinase [Planctomycetota bacterium]|nr:FGGY-family carbohydrate kinase [Planctomycetota bacterium]
MQNGKLYLGIDAGTGGVRCTVCTANGFCTAAASEPLVDAEVPGLPAGRHEQHPESWWAALVKCVRRLDCDLAQVAALCVDSTSGTVLFLDSSGKPLRPAIMYNDARSASQAARANAAAGDFLDRHGFRFGSSFALPKVLWVMDNEPELFDRAAIICHAADYLAGRLCGACTFTDTSNALKMGCDLFDSSWPAFIASLGIPAEKLPRLLNPGQQAGAVCSSAARETGLPENTCIVAGCTDGTAGFLASGASAEGHWASTLGTTLVIRGISREVIRDPAGRVYCHRHPAGCWLPGAACSVGGECLAHFFPSENLAALDDLAAALRTTDLVCYPLVRRGERFPFTDDAAEGFFSREAASREELYLALLEGVAFAERWAMEVLGSLGANVAGPVFATGGGAASGVWLGIRASVLGRELHVPERAGCEFGAAALAAAPEYGGVADACRGMVRIAHIAAPDAARKDYYEDKYARFRRLCTARGYVTA